MTTIEDLKELYEKFLKGQCDQHELDQLMLFFQETATDVLKKMILQKLKDDTAIVHDDQDHTQRYTRMWTNVHRKIVVENKSIKRFWPKIVIAASMTVFLSIGFYLYFNQQQPIALLNIKQHVHTDVAPGGNYAYLTLSDGRKIPLVNLIKDTGKRFVDEFISNNNNGELQYLKMPASGLYTDVGLHKLETPKGGQYKVTLSDGTHVWLNAASSLTYHANFESLRERRITLTGEAYFEVNRDILRPFIVQTGDQQVEVLGTHFNVNAYHDNGGSYTTLIEGRIIAKTNSSEIVIQPGQQVTTTSAGKLKVREVDKELAIAWKNNQFMFDSEPIEPLMKKLARWYDVKIIYEGEKPTTHFNGGVSKFENISSVLKILESTGKVHFRIEDRTIYVRK